jgi:hypothetical protein
MSFHGIGVETKGLLKERISTTSSVLRSSADWGGGGLDRSASYASNTDHSHGTVAQSFTDLPLLS